jgi:hypothetical protein
MASAVDSNLKPWQDEYMSGCLAKQASMEAVIGMKPTELGAQQTVLQCIMLSKIQPDGSFKN